MSKNWQVVMQSGLTLEMPRDAARSEYERLSVYGLQAVLERVRRTKGYKIAIDDGDSIAMVVTPKGDEITQF